MLIEVTQDDIDQGCQGDNLRCPVARAACRALAIEGGPVTALVAVAADTLRIYSSGKTYKLPKHVQLWIKTFDESVITGDMPEPISFELN